MKLSPLAFCLLMEAHSILENPTHKEREIVMLTMTTNSNGVGHPAFPCARHHTGSLTVGSCQGRGLSTSVSQRKESRLRGVKLLVQGPQQVQSGTRTANRQQGPATDQLPSMLIRSTTASSVAGGWG